MPVENLALFFHLLGAFLFVSGALVAGVAFEAGRRRQSCGEIALLLGLARIGAVFLGIGVLLVLGFGLWLVRIGHWGYRAGWVDAAIALLVAAIVLGAIGGQTPKRARRLASRLATDDRPVSDELRALLDDRISRASNYLTGLLVLAILVLMIWKPGATHS